MNRSSYLILSLLLLSQSLVTRAAQIEKKQWQDVPSENHDGGAEYNGDDIGQYQNTGEYTGSDIGAYSGGYSNDYGSQINNNGYSDPNSNYNGDIRSNGYTDQSANGYGGEQIHNNAYGGEQVQNNGYTGEQVPSSGYGAEVHSTSYSSSGYGDLNGHGYGGAGYTGEDGYGAGMSNEGWERPVKTVVKHVLKNIAVPHPVPAPVHVPVPKYVKYFKPFAIAKPVAVPHVIPVIKHIQKPVPFFASVPVKHSVPVPKFVGLPVQVRVPRPVFIHVPKVVPVAKKVHIPVHVNIPRPYIVPVYKHVPVPVPHKVPKVINVIKEVPHYVKKPVPVYVDDHPSFSSGGHTLTSSTYSNHYGNSGNFENFGGAGYGNEEDLFGGSQDMGSQGGNSYNSAGMDYGKGVNGDFGQHSYSGSQSSLIFNNPFLFSRQKLQGFRDFNFLQQQKLQVPSQSYPRAHRQPNKGGDKIDGFASYKQQPGLLSYNYSSNVPGSSYELNVELNQGNAGSNVNYNSADQQGGNYNQGQASGLNEMFFQNNKMANQMSAVNSLANPVIKLPLENINSQFSQPVYNPNAYAEFAMNQQSGYNHSYSQPYGDQKTLQNAESSTQNMMAQASKPQFYNQHPENAYSLTYNSNYQNGGLNNIPQMPDITNFNNPKVPFIGGGNIDLNNAYNDKNNYGSLNLENGYKSSNPISSSQGYQSQWPSNSFSQDVNTVMQQMQQFNQQQQAAYSQTSSQSTLGYNQGFANSNFNVNPSSYSSGQGGYQQSTYANNENNSPVGYQQNTYANNENNSPVGYQQNTYSNNENNSPLVYQQNTYANNENNSPVGYQQNTYANNENNSPLGYQQNTYGNNQNNPQLGFQQTSYINSENNPREGYQQTAFANNGRNANLNNYVPSGSSSSSTSYSESPSQSNQDFQTSIATNSFMKQNEKFDQSSSQTSYTSDANIALPGVYSNSRPSVSYSSSSYGNNFNNMQGYNQEPTNQATNNNAGQVEAASQLNVQSQFNDPTQFTNPGQFANPGQPDNLNQFRDTNVLNNPTMYSNFNQLTNQNTAYLNQQEALQPAYNGNSKYDDQIAASYANLVNTGPSSTYSPSSTASSSYSSSQSVSKSEFSPPAEKSYLLPSKPIKALGRNNNNKTEPHSSNNNNSPSNGKPSYSTSFSYSYTEKVSKPEAVYSNIQNPSKLSKTTQTLNSPQSSQNSQIQYSPQIKTPDLPDTMSNMDEMEKHIQSSASSIINVYTNSPESMGGKKGQTFSFMDPVALGSSQSTTFFQPQDADENPRLQYSGDDLKVASGPAYPRDPAEPLQTSLDAYVPMQPVYHPSPNDQNTVYKEAMSEMDDYKEAISLNSDSEQPKKS